MSKGGPTVTEFDPNNAEHLKNVWMVYTGSWRGIYLTSNRPSALNKVSAARTAKLYEYVLLEQRWVLRAFKGDPNRPDSCDFCGGSVKDSHDPSYYNRSGYHWKREKGKIVSPPAMVYVCDPCSSSVRYR